MGKALAEGDYLSAAPFFTDFIKAVKTAVPGLLKETAVKKLAAIESKLGVPQAPPPMPVYETPAEAKKPNLMLYAALGVGGFLLLRKFTKRSR